MKNLGFYKDDLLSDFYWNLQEFLFKEGYCKATAISCTGRVTLPQLQLLSSTSLCGWEGRQFLLHIKLLAEFVHCHTIFHFSLEILFLIACVHLQFTNALRWQ